MYVCGPITIIPGTIAIVLGILTWRREQAMIEFSTWLKSHRRIKMDDMAARIGFLPLQRILRALRAHRRRTDGRSPSMTRPEFPSMVMYMGLPLKEYSTNQTGACRSSTSVIVG